MKRFPVTIPQMPEVFEWDTQASQYREIKPRGPGITYFRPVFDMGPVDCLLMYNADLALVGILNYFPENLPPYERAGNFTMFTRPDRRRRGVATALMDEARRRWLINFDQQDYSPEGAAFATAYVNRRSLPDGISRTNGHR